MAELSSLNRAVGARIKSCRAYAGMNQEALASRIKLSRASVSNIESGRQGVSIETLWLIAQALGVSILKLIPEERELAPTESKSREPADDELKFQTALVGNQ